MHLRLVSVLFGGESVCVVAIAYNVKGCAAQSGGEAASSHAKR